MKGILSKCFSARLIILHITASCLILSSCYAKPLPHNELISPISLPNVPQNALFYQKNINKQHKLLSLKKQKKYALSMRQHFFSPWQNNNRFTKNLYKQENDILQRFHHVSQYYGFNFHHIKLSWLYAIEHNMNLGKFPNANINAIVIRNTSLRMLPTSLPIFYSYKLAGQGYPFDNLQMSAFWAGKPIHISQISRDGLWALVQDNELSGWIRMSDLGFVNKEFINKYHRAALVAILKDNVAIKTKDKLALFNSRIGMLFPTIKNKVYVPYINKRHYAKLINVNLAKSLYSRFPVVINTKNIALLINNMLGEPYGWGGLYQLRDCSLTLQNLFMTFGILLPRNSAAQAASGKEISLRDMPLTLKRNIIEQKARPFLTLLHMPGHITLYLGNYDGELIIFQIKWGIATDDDHNHPGRAVIGQANIAPLSFGKYVHDANTTFLQEVNAMTILN